jgi:DNA primase
MQEREPGSQTPLDLRYVQAPTTPGLHEERTASLKAYPNGSWYCYGCHQGGSIFDFAATLWGRDTRGVAFVELRADLARMLLGVELPTPDTLRQAPVGV